MKRPSKDKRKYCWFHCNYNHDTEKYFQLKDVIEALIRRRFLTKFWLNRPTELQADQPPTSKEIHQNWLTTEVINKISMRPRARGQRLKMNQLKNDDSMSNKQCRRITSLRNNEKKKHQPTGCELVGLSWLVKNATYIDLAMIESRDGWFTPDRHGQRLIDKKLTKSWLEIDRRLAYTWSTKTSTNWSSIGW